jgi:hypothetical protein
MSFMVHIACRPLDAEVRLDGPLKMPSHLPFFLNHFSHKTTTSFKSLATCCDMPGMDNAPFSILKVIEAEVVVQLLLNSCLCLVMKFMDMAKAFQTGLYALA